MGAGSFNPNGGTGTIGGEAYSYSPVSQSTSNNAVSSNAPMPQQGGTSQNGNFSDIYDPYGTLNTLPLANGASNPYQGYVNATSSTTPNSGGGLIANTPNQIGNTLYPPTASSSSPTGYVDSQGTPVTSAGYAYNPNAPVVDAGGGLSSLVPQQPMYSGAQPTTNALQSFIGSNTNPYANTTSPYFGAAQAQTLGNLAGAQQATQANRVNQNTLYGGLNYQQGVDQYGNPTWTANQTGTPQTQNLANSSLASLQASVNNPAYGINPGQTYSDAIMQRLQPQMAQSAESNKAALANQGIVPGTQAYDNAMRTFQQGQNDLLTSAQIQGMNTGLQAQALQGTQAGQIKSLATPNLINAPQQAAVAGPDYTGALATQTNANIAAQNAALGQQTNQTAGLYGLGSAGILGLAANPGLVGSAYNGISSLFNSPANSTNLWTDPTSAGNFAGSAFTL